MGLQGHFLLRMVPSATLLARSPIGRRGSHGRHIRVPAHPHLPHAAHGRRHAGEHLPQQRRRTGRSAHRVEVANELRQTGFRPLVRRYKGRHPRWELRLRSGGEEGGAGKAEGGCGGVFLWAEYCGEGYPTGVQGDEWGGCEVPVLEGAFLGGMGYYEGCRMKL